MGREGRLWAQTGAGKEEVQKTQLSRLLSVFESEETDVFGLSHSDHSSWVNHFGDSGLPNSSRGDPTLPQLPYETRASIHRKSWAMAMSRSPVFPLLEKTSIQDMSHKSSRPRKGTKSLKKKKKKPTKQKNPDKINLRKETEKRVTP